MPSPIKRHQDLQAVSREHHFGLLLSWKIRAGFKKQIETERIKDYTNWFWENYLEAHFAFEEAYIFTILSNEHKLIKKALKDHRRLKRLFTSSDKVERSLWLIEEELDAHIRFEERILFKEIEQIATVEQMNLIAKSHTSKLPDDWKDEFWN